MSVHIGFHAPKVCDLLVRHTCGVSDLMKMSLCTKTLECNYEKWIFLFYKILWKNDLGSIIQLLLHANQSYDKHDTNEHNTIDIWSF